MTTQGLRRRADSLRAPAAPAPSLGALAKIADDVVLALNAMASEHASVFADMVFFKRTLTQAERLATALRKRDDESFEDRVQEQTLHASASGKRPQDDPRWPKARRMLTISMIARRAALSSPAITHWFSSGGPRKPLPHVREPFGNYRERILISNQDLFAWAWTYRRDVLDRMWGR